MKAKDAAKKRKKEERKKKEKERKKEHEENKTRARRAQLSAAYQGFLQTDAGSRGVGWPAFFALDSIGWRRCSR